MFAHAGRPVIAWPCRGKRRMANFAMLMNSKKFPLPHAAGGTFLSNALRVPGNGLEVFCPVLLKEVVKLLVETAVMQLVHIGV